MGGDGGDGGCGGAAPWKHWSKKSAPAGSSMGCVGGAASVTVCGGGSAASSQ